MKKSFWVAMGWLWFFLAPWSAATGSTAPAAKGTCTGSVNKTCANRVGDVVAFTVEMNTGDTTIYIVTHDLTGVERVTVTSDNKDFRFYNIAVGVNTFRYHTRIWCKPFGLNEQDLADALEAAVAPEIAAIQGHKTTHQNTRTMIKTLELALVLAIQAGDAAGAASLVAQIDGLESADSTTLAAIKQSQDNITSSYGQQPDAKSAILQLDLIAFVPDNVLQPNAPAEPAGFTEVPEGQEENPGFRVVQNGDDDNTNDSPDTNDIQVVGENDLAQAWWFYAKPIDVPQRLRLERGGNALGTWKERTKNAAEPLPKTVDASYERKGLYLEGRLPSTAFLAESITGVHELSADCRDVLQGTSDAVSAVAFQAPAGAAAMFDGTPNFQPGGNVHAGGGDRVFPDRNTPAGALNDIVRVRATVTPARAGVTVLFKPYDVDDPSADTAPIDDDPAQAENHEDNRGLVGTNAEGQLAGADADGIASAVTDGAGVAEINFQVTRQPGDNFRVVASLLRARFTGLRVRHPDGDGFVRDRAGDPLLHPGSGTTNMFRQSGLLTVWRQLHVERDSVENVIGNSVTGTVMAVAVRGRNATITIDRALEDENQYLTEPRGNAVARFVSGGVVYEVNANTAGAVPETVVIDIPRGGAPPPVGAAFTLFDDDVNAVVPALPDAGLMDLKHRPAYLLVMNDEGGVAGANTQNIPFDVNVEDDSVDAQVTFGQATHASRHQDFWIVYMQSAFQGPLQEDFDPNERAEVVSGPGRTSSDGRGSLLYREQRRDVGTNYVRLVPADIVLWEQAAFVHEVGHQWFLDDGTGGIMSSTTPRHAVTPDFTADHLRRIRSKRQSPGVVD